MADLLRSSFDEVLRLAGPDPSDIAENVIAVPSTKSSGDGHVDR